MESIGIKHFPFFKHYL